MKCISKQVAALPDFGVVHLITLTRDYPAHTKMLTLNDVYLNGYRTLTSDGISHSVATSKARVTTQSQIIYEMGWLMLLLHYLLKG